MIHDGNRDEQLVGKIKSILEHAAIDALPRAEQVPTRLEEYLTDTLCLANIYIAATTGTDRRALNAFILDSSDAEEALSALIGSGQVAYDNRMKTLWVTEPPELMLNQRLPELPYS